VIANSAYQTGLLRAFHSFSGRYELAADGRRQGRLRRVRKAKYVVLGYHRVGTTRVFLFIAPWRKTYLQTNAVHCPILPGTLG